MARPPVRLGIDEGPLSAEDRIDDVPRDRWSTLVGLRKAFLHIHLPHDCRQLLRFVEEAETHRMWEALGLADRETFLREKLDLDPADVTWALHALHRWKPDEPLPYPEAIQLGRQEYGKGKPGPGRGHKTGYNVTRFTRGHAPAYGMARLARDRPDLHARVLARELSPHAAMIEAGFRRRTLAVPDDPHAALLKLRDRYGLDKLVAIITAWAAENECSRLPHDPR